MSDDGFRQDGRDIYLGKEKIGFFPEGRDVPQMAKGKVAYRTAVLRWLGKQDDHEPAEDDDEDDQQDGQEKAPKPAAEPVKEAPKTKPSATPAAKPDEKPPVGAPGMGDKDPAVVAWWFENRPEQARKRYAQSKFPGREKYFGN